MEASELDATLACAAELFAKLRRLERDCLPDYEQRFFDLLRNQSHQNLAALAAHLTQAAKMIREKLEMVNESLTAVHLNTGAFLRIALADLNREEVRQFRQDIQSALSDAWTGNREEAEERSRVLRGLVNRLSSQEPEARRWRNLVLDVRQHADSSGVSSTSGGMKWRCIGADRASRAGRGRSSRPLVWLRRFVISWRARRTNPRFMRR